MPLRKLLLKILYQLIFFSLLHYQNSFIYFKLSNLSFSTSSLASDSLFLPFLYFSFFKSLLSLFLSFYLFSFIFFSTIVSFQLIFSFFLPAFTTFPLLHLHSHLSHFLVILLYVFHRFRGCKGRLKRGCHITH